MNHARGSRYWAYLSYNHADETITRQIHQKLERFRIPKGLADRSRGRSAQLSSTHLRPVFRDREDLSSAGELSRELHAALDASTALIVICSPAAANSYWVNEEIAYYIASGRSARIFPLIIAGEPNSDDEQECFPPALRRNNPDGIEPIAADMRRGRDGPKDAFLKLAAGLLDVPFDALKQRAVQAQHRRQMAATAIATAVAVSTSALAFYALEQRDIAELRRAQAEDLISFMLGDLRNRLQSLGRLEVLDAVGEQAEVYFQTIPPSELDEHALEKQALSLRQIGEVRLDQGRFEMAASSFQESLTRWQNLARRIPDRPDYLFERGQAEFWVGFVHYNNGALETARVHFTDYLNTSLDLAHTHPEEPVYQLELLYSSSNLGTLANEMGESQAARSYFEQAHQVGKRLLDAEPNNATYQLEHAGNLSWLGRLAEQAWHLDAAINYETRATQILEPLLGESDFQAWDMHAASCNNLAVLHWFKGETEKAASNSDCAVQGYSNLTNHDESNETWHQRLLSARTMQMRIAWNAGEDVNALYEQLRGEFSPINLSADSPLQRQYAHFYAASLLAGFEPGQPPQSYANNTADRSMRDIEAACFLEAANFLADQRTTDTSNCLNAPESRLRISAAAWRSILMAVRGDHDGSARIRARLEAAAFAQPDYRRALVVVP